MAVRQTLTTGFRAAAKARKDFEEGFKREIETDRKWITERFDRGADAIEKVVEDSLRDLDDSTTIDDALSLS